MTVATRKARTFLFPVIGLLMLAGTAWAQLDCPLPADVPPPAEPRVTARQVEDGSATLAAFALAVRDQWAGEGLDAEKYVKCLVRQEGSAWRSGSTYIVLLGPAGRVDIHAGDMSLSGRRLDPAIFAAVLQALGIDRAALSGPTRARAAFAAAAEGDGGPFDVPALPGASGYAAVFRPAGVLPVRVLITGFDLVESHLVPIAAEDIDYGDPQSRGRGRGRPRDPQGLRHGSGGVRHIAPGVRRPGGSRESQDRPAGSGRPVAARSPYTSESSSVPAS